MIGIGVDTSILGKQKLSIHEMSARFNPHVNVNIAGIRYVIKTSLKDMIYYQ